MKKIIVAVVMLVSSGLYAQSMELKYGQTSDGKLYYTQFRVGLPIEYKQFRLEPYVGQLTWTEWAGNFQNGKPFSETYEIGSRLTYRDTFFIEYNHYCRHDVIVYRDVAGTPIAVNSTMNRWDQALTTITVGVKYTYYKISLD